MKKRRWSAALCLCMALSCIPVSAFAADTDSTVEITTAAQLYELSQSVSAGKYHADKTYKLMNDIDLSEYNEWIPIGCYLKPFTGTFDGQEHVITGMKIENAEYAGLFGYVKGMSEEEKAQVKNVIVKDAKIQVGSGDNYSYSAGAVVGCYDKNTNALNGCEMRGGSIHGYNMVGGIAGNNDSAVIENCSVTGSVNGTSDDIGGIAGHNFKGIIKNCFVIGTVSGYRGVGGVTGCNNQESVIQNCYVTGKIIGKSNEYGDSQYAGGITGENRGEIINSYLSGTVSGEEYIGGIAGGANCNGTASTIRNCYAVGTVSGAKYVGGIVGSNGYKDEEKCTIQNCAALNESVTSETDTVYRITTNENGILTNNYAWSGMTVNGKTVTDGAADHNNGADLTCTDGKLSKQFSELFNNDEAWNFADNKLPTLKNINAEQSNSLPDWLHTHSYTETVTPPTCTEKGYTTYTCVCGESYVDNDTNALGHDYQNGTCTRCNEKDPNYQKPVEEVFSDVKPTDWFYPEVQYVYDNELMNGTDLGFEPNMVLTRSMMMTILWRMDGKPAPSGTTSFTDVKAGEWYADAIAWAQESNISNGYGDGTFGTFDSITREQMVTMFHRYAQCKGYDVSVSADLSAYSDAGKVSNYASVPMKWAVGCGLMKGRTETTLEPQGTATRAEAATIMHRFDTIVKK